MRRIITAGRLITGPVGGDREDAGVLVDGEVIAAVGSRAELTDAAGPGVEVEHHPDGALLPGMVNGHVHLAFDAEMGVVETLEATDDDALLAQMAEHAETLLRTGVTTARDLGDRHGLAARLRDRIAAGEAVGPRILTATAPVTPVKGHCWFLGGEVADAEAIPAKVAENIALGADLIKVMVSGGGLTPGGAAMHETQFDARFLSALVAEAHRRGLPVAAHAHNPDSIAAAVAAGVDTIEHCMWRTADYGFEPDEQMAREIARRGIAVCHADSIDWRRFAHRMGEEASQAYHRRTAWLDGLGVPLVTGTDAGVFPFDETPDVLARLHTDWGLPAARVVEIATTESARNIGLEGVTGVLAAGAAADCVLVDGDPLDDIRTLRNVDLVLARGRATVPDPAERHRPVYSGVGAAR